MEFLSGPVIYCTNEDVNNKDRKRGKEIEHEKDVDKENTAHNLIDTVVLTISKDPRIGINKSSFRGGFILIFFIFV
ncbi:MAG: hypothetical protein ACTSUO_03190 [Candidatus Thorarchaeota archaeon]